MLSAYNLALIGRPWNIVSPGAFCNVLAVNSYRLGILLTLMSVWNNSHISASADLAEKYETRGSVGAVNCAAFLLFLFSAPERVRGARYTERMSLASCTSYWNSLIQKWAAGGTLE